jgi:O-antigen/teichoic acid export membrane protein
MARLTGLLLFARWVPTLFAAMVAAFGVLAMSQVAGLRISGAASALIVAIIVIPISVFSELTSGALRAFKLISQSMLGDSLVRPLLVAAMIGVMFVTGARITASAAVGMFGTATVIVAFLVALWLRRVVRMLHVTARPEYESRMWFSIALPMMVANGFLILLYSADVLLIGAIRTTQEAGIFSLAARIALLVLFVMNAIQTISAPLMAEAFSRRENDRVQAIVTKTVVGSLAAGLLLASVCWLVGLPVLESFGPGFALAYKPLVILVAAQLVNIATGPVGFLLNLSGHQNRLMTYLGIAVVVDVLLNLALVPRYGVIGAAWSAFAAHSLWNILGAVFAARRLGISVLPIIRHVRAR